MEPVPCPDNAGERPALDVDLISAEEHLLKASGLKRAFRGLVRAMQAPRALAVCLSPVHRCSSFDTSASGCLNHGRLSRLHAPSVYSLPLPFSAEVSVVIREGPGVGANHSKTQSAASPVTSLGAQRRKLNAQ